MQTPSLDDTPERLPRVGGRASLGPAAEASGGVQPQRQSEEGAPQRAGHAPHDRAHHDRVHLARAREDALAAMEHAVEWLGIDPSALSADAYRAFRESEAGAHLPSPLAINILFGGWERAREQAAALSRDNTVIEAEVIRAIYGDPDCRHRAYGTSTAPEAEHDSRSRDGA